MFESIHASYHVKLRISPHAFAVYLRGKHLKSFIAESFKNLKGIIIVVRDYCTIECQI